MSSPSTQIDYHQRKRQQMKLDGYAAAMVIDPVSTPEDLLLMKEEAERLDAVVDTLPLREALVVRWRFGLRCEPMLYNEIAERLGTSRTRPHQIVEGRALPRLARKLRHDYPERHLGLQRRWHERAGAEARRFERWKQASPNMPVPPVCSPPPTDKEMSRRYRDLLIQHGFGGFLPPGWPYD